jgi:hypothetical protein
VSVYLSLARSLPQAHTSASTHAYARGATAPGLPASVYSPARPCVCTCALREGATRADGREREREGSSTRGRNADAAIDRAPPVEGLQTDSLRLSPPTLRQSNRYLSRSFLFVTQPSLPTCFRLYLPTRTDYNLAIRRFRKL